MNTRDWQRLSQVLALLLVVILGAAAIVVFLRPGSPSETPTPSNIAVGSPSGSPEETPSPSASPSPTVKPTRTPKPSKSPRATASPTGLETLGPSPSGEPPESLPPNATPTPRPTPSPKARTITLVGVGFDSSAATTPTKRQIGFDTDGPGDVSVKLIKDNGGTVHFCLQRVGGSATCIDADHGTLNGTTSASGKTSWVVTGLATGAVTPIASVRVSFSAQHPNVSVSGFRFQGTENTGFNGIEADIDQGAGPVKVRGTLTSPHPWQVKLIDSGTLAVIGNQTGTGTSLSLQADTTPRDLHLSVKGTELFTDQEVFLDATVRWQ